MTEVYFLFYQAVLPTFSTINLLLQREDPTIADAIREFLKKLFSKFIQVQVIASVDNITDVNFTDSRNHLDYSHITVGFLTNQRNSFLMKELLVHMIKLSV